MFSKKGVKFIIGFVAVVLIVWIAFEGASKYQNWQKWRNIKKQAEEFEKIEKERMELIANDAYGGKTPQETLEMFIKAVEAGNYELASKYFVVEKQGEELEILKKTNEKNNVDFLLDYLNQLKNVNGYFSSSNDRYTIEKPIFIEFIKYPSNLWKINEI